MLLNGCKYAAVYLCVYVHVSVSVCLCACVCRCPYLCVYVHVCAGSIGARRGCRHLEHKSQVVASHSIQMQGMELWSYTRIANSFFLIFDFLFISKRFTFVLLNYACVHTCVGVCPCV